MRSIEPDRGLLLAASRSGAGTRNCNIHHLKNLVQRYENYCYLGWEAESNRLAHEIRQALIIGGEKR